MRGIVGRHRHGFDSVYIDSVLRTFKKISLESDAPSFYLSFFSEKERAFVRKVLLVTLLFLLLGLPLWAQSSYRGDLSSHIDSLINSIPSGTSTDQYQTPAPSVKPVWISLIYAILEKNYSGAAVIATTVGYEVIDFEDISTIPSTKHILLKKHPASMNHWGIYLFHQNPRRRYLTIQSPHVLNDLRTGSQGVSVYKTIHPLALFLNGAHRCNSSLPSPCSGTTTTCTGNDEKYRMSDQAHTVEGMFQYTSEAIIQKSDSVVFVQLHGFAKTITDPDIIMGNGTMNAPSGTDYLLLLKENLRILDNSLTFKIAHVDNWTRLAGTTNTQGRLLNGASDPCLNNVSNPRGRFLHLEQAFAKLRDTEQNRLKMAYALQLTFPQTPTAVPEELQNPVRPGSFRLFQNYPNPFNPTTTVVFELDVPSVVVFDLYDAGGKLLFREGSRQYADGRHSRTINIPSPSGVYFLQATAIPLVAEHSPISQTIKLHLIR